MREIARESEGETVLLTFYPHPRMVLFPHDHGLELLNTIDEKKILLADAGIDHLILHPFSKHFSRLSATEYVRDVLVNQIAVHTTVVGYDHHFGKNREGDFNQLSDLAEVYDFEVREIEARQVDSMNISSTKIRRALKKGDVQTANDYLGYNYSLTGCVIHGDAVGRKLGFPTANINVEDDTKLIPGEGAYAILAKCLDKEWKGMLNIGVRPTLNSEAKLVIETHLFDFQEDIYNEQITVQLVARIRDEKKFDGPSSLSIQLAKDKDQAIALLQ
jgi:riboflavin kinase/FMN adenylyltransferase